MKNAFSIMLMFTVAAGVCSSAMAEDGGPAKASDGTFLDALKARYELVWSDEFGGETLDLKNWRFEGSSVHRNGEKQVYADTMEDGNIRVEDGKLVIIGKKEDRKDSKGRLHHYTSASIRTDGLHHFRYGILEMRAKLPKGQGVWPAFWMMGYDEQAKRARWPHTGEIDILELWGGGSVGDRRVKGAMHYWSDSKNKKTATGGGRCDLLDGQTYNDDFHTFGILWTEKELAFYVDDVITRRVDITHGDFHAFRDYEFYFLINLALGSSYYKISDDLPFPQEYAVDYVRVWQSKVNPDAPSTTDEFCIFEAEDCSPKGTSDTKTTKIWDTWYPTLAISNATSKGSYLELTTSVVPAGKYQVYVVTRDAPTRGVYQASIDGKDVGEPINFACETLSMRNHKIGTITSDGEGETTLRLTCIQPCKQGLYVDQVVLVKADGK